MLHFLNLLFCKLLLKPSHLELIFHSNESYLHNNYYPRFIGLKHQLGSQDSLNCLSYYYSNQEYLLVMQSRLMSLFEDNIFDPHQLMISLRLLKLSEQDHQIKHQSILDMIEYYLLHLVAFEVFRLLISTILHYLALHILYPNRAIYQTLQIILFLRFIYLLLHSLFMVIIIFIIHKHSYCSDNLAF